MNHPLLIAPTDALPDEQRIRRICELLSKAMILDVAGRIVSPAAAAAEAIPKTTRPEQLVAETGSDVARIESYLALIGEASPAMIRETLGLPRMRIYRAAQRLLAAGTIMVSGQTRTVTYRLSAAPTEKLSHN
jgi:hypothetical protein